jgi:hypothetical protein
MRSRIPAQTLLALLATALLAGCSASGEVSIGGKSLDPDDVEKTISKGLGDRAGLPDPEVSCAGVEDVDVEGGSEFACTGTAPNGEQFPINVMLTDDEGGYRYEVPPSDGSAPDAGA